MTEDQIKVLRYVKYFEGETSGPHVLHASFRQAWKEISDLGLIEPFTRYRLTDAGRTALTEETRSGSEG